MGWIISTWILGGLLFVAILAVCILYFIAARRIRELSNQANSLYWKAERLKNKFLDERKDRNAIVDRANAEIGKANNIIEEKNLSIKSWIEYASKSNNKYDSVKNKLDKANETIKELKTKLERTNEIIDRLSNMNAPQPAPQPIMEPQIIQNIVA